MTNHCECTLPEGGFCERHKIRMSAYRAKLCRTNVKYFELFEQDARALPAMAKVSSGLGDRVEGMLKTLGITQERYKEVKQLFGLPPTCGCAKRKEWLNKVGQWLNGE